MASVEERLAALEARVAAIDDERGVLANMYRYAHAIDYGLDGESIASPKTASSTSAGAPTSTPSRASDTKGVTRWARSSPRTRRRPRPTTST